MTSTLQTDRTHTFAATTVGFGSKPSSDKNETLRALNIENARLVRSLMNTKPSDAISRVHQLEDFEKSRRYLRLARKLRMDLPKPKELIVDWDHSQRLKR